MDWLTRVFADAAGVSMLMLAGGFGMSRGLSQAQAAAGMPICRAMSS